MSHYLQWIKDELRSTPGRGSFALRLTLSCCLVSVLFISLQIPFLAVAIIVVFYVSQPNIVMTTGIGIGFVVIALLGLGGELLIIKWTYDYPLIRLVASLFLFFWSMFLMRVLGKLGLAFFVVALVLIYAQTFPSMTGESEILVRLILWIWMAMVITIVVTVLVHACFIQSYPHYQYRKILAQLYQHISEALQNSAHPMLSLAKTADYHAQLNTLYKLASLSNQSFKTHQQTWYALSNLAIRGVEIAALYQLKNTEHQAPAAEQLAVEFKTLAETVSDGKLPMPGKMAFVDTQDRLLNLLNQLLQQATSGTPVAPPPGAPDKIPLMLADAWSNPVYLQFALKTLLASLLCYVFYTATDWQGIHTIMLTCVIVAQPGLGATYQKATLRVIGALVATAIALVLMVFVQPHLQSIVGLMLMIAPVFAISSWIAAGSERIAYAGIQLAFTFGLAFLNGFGPMTNLTELRDRVIGILLGLLVASVTYLYLWPDSDAPRLKSRLSALYRQLASYFKAPAGEGNTLLIYQGIGQAETLLDHVKAEPLNSFTHPYAQAKTWPAQESIDELQTLLRLVQGYQYYASADDHFLATQATYLLDYASHIDSQQPYSYSLLGQPDPHNPFGEALANSLVSLPVWKEDAVQISKEAAA